MSALSQLICHTQTPVFTELVALENSNSTNLVCGIKTNNMGLSRLIAIL